MVTILYFLIKNCFLQDSHNQQNDRVYAVNFQDAPRHKLAVERFQNAAGVVMVWRAISKRGKLSLLFIDRGVKIDQNYYQTHILENHLNCLHPKPLPRRLLLLSTR